MTTREYMNRPYELKRQIGIKINQLQGIRNLINGTTAAISCIPRSDSPDPHKLEQLMVQSLDLEMEIQKLTENLARATNEVASAIDSINNPSCEEVLTARYLCFKDWTTIAREMDYCKDWVFRLHRKGLGLVRI